MRLQITLPLILAYSAIAVEMYLPAKVQDCIYELTRNMEMQGKEFTREDSDRLLRQCEKRVQKEDEAKRLKQESVQH
ncbi:hypothetical protein MGG_17926 [Pyricularia oryzae 70-15]|uniref:Secreted protein n=4 Tax=Pyricularia oryzae TaxID=318829 RepID=G5EHH3_PYRO7|nr:uncharacterized protein MGG_17926 [Pyricularia oryzae 70-15]ELQ40192.1 hypothetical protein OOU_Y34scaffold00458g20 [Pyricularia oryzae Y34]KAI7921429.1 hypothetical protein M9X92_005400 [Pyricularia oryzae]EAQ71274.1 hypothetical protein MGCH7_ch7g681 [Pyricularia oryzae 70-15]EHA46059.1 hypothetical protein MGG_17926 [Pyricularia oryzae 70-15]KAI7922136.1 hypothetical protein M0657_005756 [Pyricularia oryzae]